jgi:gliding motility-associated-like protein
VVIINDYPQLNYAWTSTDNGSITTTPLSSTTTGGDLTLNTTPTTNTTYTLNVTNEGGCVGTASITINVGNVTVSPPSSNPTLCADTPITPVITFTTTGATGIGAATNLPNGVTATYSNNTITVSGTPTNSGTFNYTIPVTGGCTGLNAIGTITVNPVNTVTAASSNPTLCVNTALSSSITFTTTGATGIGSATNLPAGVSASWFGNTITISGTPSASGSFNYSIPLTGGCGAVNATGTITVVALPVITLTPDDPNTCNATDGSILVSGTGNGTITWSGPTSGNASSSLNYTIPSLGAGTYSVYFTNAAGCQSSTLQTSLANPGAPQINIISDVTNCGTSYTLPAVPFVTGTENNPQYYTGPNGTGTMISVGTVYNAPTNITLYAYDVNGACSDEEPFVITINEIPSVDPLTSVSGCPGSSINPTDFSSTPTGATFSWTNDNIAVGIPSLGNGQIATYNAPANATNANIIGTVSVTPTLNGCTGLSSSFTITILPSPTINAISNVSGCPGSSADPADFVSVPAGATFTWSNSNATIGLAASGTDQISPFNLGSNNTASPITGTISATATLNGCTSAPLTFTVSINPTPVITITQTDPSSCNGTDGSILVNTGAPGSVSWSGTSTGASGPMNTNYAITNLVAGTYDVSFTNSTTGCQSAVVSTNLLNPGAPIINPISDVTQCGGSYTLPAIAGSSLINAQYYTQPNGGGGIVSEGTLFEPDTVITLYAYDANGACTASESFTISLTSIPVITNPGAQTSCDSYTLGTFSGTNIFAPTYWTQSGGQGTPLNIGDLISTSSTVFIYDQNGACTSEESFDITIIQTPSITNPGNQSACASYSLPVIVGSDLSGSQGYFNNSQALGGTAISGAITSSQTVYIYDANGACSDEESFVVTINPLPTASLSGGDIYCQGDAVADIAASITGTADFTLNYTLDGVAQTQSGSTTSLSLGNTTGTYVLVSIIDANCTNTNLSSTQTIMINSIPPAPIAGEDTIYCANATPIALFAQGSGSFTWYSDQNLTNVLGINSSLTPSMNVGTTNYYVTETINGCEGPASMVVLEVDNCGIIVPTAFTPDGDQTNDTWTLQNIDQIYPKNVVSIYNRWGNLLYRSNSGGYEMNPWNGKFNDQDLPVEIGRAHV